MLQLNQVVNMLTLQERPWPRDPLTHIILGAEPFEFGKGDHAVLFIHGWTSTPREMRFVAEKVAAQGFMSSGLLLPGHGRTLRALKGTHFSDYLRHCEEAFGELALKHDKVSVIGLSLGGLLALHLAARRKVANLVLYAPFLFPAGSTLGIAHKHLAGYAKIWTDEIAKDAKGPINDASQLEEHIAYHAMPASILAEIMAQGQSILPLLPNITAPTLIFHSPQDRTSHFDGTLQLMRALGSEDRTLIALPRSNHVLTLDIDRDRLERETTAWLQRHR